MPAPLAPFAPSVYGAFRALHSRGRVALADRNKCLSLESKNFLESPRILRPQPDGLSCLGVIGLGKGQFGSVIMVEHSSVPAPHRRKDVAEGPDDTRQLQEAGASALSFLATGGEMG
jgi:hypothetical protein